MDCATAQRTRLPMLGEPPSGAFGFVFQRICLLFNNLCLQANSLWSDTRSVEQLSPVVFRVSVGLTSGQKTLTSDLNYLFRGYNKCLEPNSKRHSDDGTH